MSTPVLPWAKPCFLTASSFCSHVWKAKTCVTGAESDVVWSYKRFKVFTGAAFLVFFFLEREKNRFSSPERQRARTKVSVCGRDPGNYRNVAGQCEGDCLSWWRTHPLAEPSDSALSEEFRLRRSQSFASRLRICRQDRTINLRPRKVYSKHFRIHDITCMKWILPNSKS